MQYLNAEKESVKNSHNMADEILATGINIVGSIDEQVY